MTTGPFALVRHMAAIFDELGVPYALGGSLASSLIGEPRSAVDVDMAVRLDVATGDELLQRVGAEFYVPTDLARQAIRTHSSSPAPEAVGVQRRPIAWITTAGRLNAPVHGATVSEATAREWHQEGSVNRAQGPNGTWCAAADATRPGPERAASRAREPEAGIADRAWSTRKEGIGGSSPWWPAVVRPPRAFPARRGARRRRLLLGPVGTIRLTVPVDVSGLDPRRSGPPGPARAPRRPCSPPEGHVSRRSVWRCRSRS